MANDVTLEVSICVLVSSFVCALESAQVQELLLLERIT